MKSKLKRTIAIIIIIIGAFSWVYVGIRIYELRSHRYLPWQYYLTSHRRRPVSISDVSYIAPWMTFDYITKTFNLPQAYLEQTLKIQDQKYPLLTVAQYTKKTDTNTSTLIENIQVAIKKYLASSTPQ